MASILGLLAFMFVTSSLFAAAPEYLGQNLSRLVPYPYHANQVGLTNTVMSITDGRAALQLRLEMIRRAKKNIEVEYFIYNLDLSSKLFTQELVRAANRGVKVRVLIDKSAAVFKFSEYHGLAMRKRGIEVRYYNKAPLVDVSTVQFRNHRKLISVDDKEAITGGRNIGNDYFDLSRKFNFNDTDIHVRGPIVKVMRETFDKYFEHKISERINPKEFIDQDKKDAAESFFAETYDVIQLRDDLERDGKKNLRAIKSHVCTNTTYVTDGPGSTFSSRIKTGYEDKYKFVRKVLFDKITSIDKSILISSPYLLANDNSDEIMNHLIRNKVDISVYTNSLASTDAIYVASNLYFDVFKWSKKGLHIYLHDGQYIEENSGLEDQYKTAKWGTHSKVQVYESRKSSEVMIGTYNIDNRSNFYNSEMALFCKGNEEFTKEVKGHINFLIQNGIKINTNGTASDRHGKKKSVFGSSEKDVKLMKLIFLPSWLLKFLL